MFTPFSSELHQYLKQFKGNLQYPKIGISGVAGSGKTNLAMQLAEELNISVIDIEPKAPDNTTNDDILFHRNYILDRMLSEYNQRPFISNGTIFDDIAYFNYYAKKFDWNQKHQNTTNYLTNLWEKHYTYETYDIIIFNDTYSPRDGINPELQHYVNKCLQDRYLHMYNTSSYTSVILLTGTPEPNIELVLPHITQLFEA